MDDLVLILDNGAYTIKSGLSTSSTNEAKVVPNAIVRSKGDKKMYIGPEILRCRDYVSLHFRLPFDKGYLNDWDAEKAVWDCLFRSEGVGVNPGASSCLVTEPYFNLPKIQDTYDQLIFEEYEFNSSYRAPGASFIPSGTLYGQEQTPECVLIVDSGYSFTHVVPLITGSIIWKAVRRIDIGGKLLTNHLKEIVSYRHYNMMSETFIVNNIKEACCFVSQSFASDLGLCRDQPRNNPIVQEYVLPDISANRHGYVRGKGQNLDQSGADLPVLVLENERFTIPELLFHPSYIGLDQAGLAETISECISQLPYDLQGLLWANIGLIGGSTAFKGFKDRLSNELRPLAPTDCVVQIWNTSEPITEVYRAAWSLARSNVYAQHVVTKAEYEEGGSNACRRKFAGRGSQVDDVIMEGKNNTPETSIHRSTKVRVGSRSRPRTLNEDPPEREP